MGLSRRTFLQTSTAGLLVSQLPIVAAQKVSRDKLTDEVGITTGSFMRHLTVERQPGKLRLLDLPKIMREELNMRVIDLMTRTRATELRPASSPALSTLLQLCFRF